MSRQRKKHPRWAMFKNFHGPHFPGWKHQPRWRQRVKAMKMEAKHSDELYGILAYAKEIWIYPGSLWDACLEQEKEWKKGWTNDSK